VLASKEQIAETDLKVAKKVQTSINKKLAATA
jgi:hypothetical protein